MKNIAIIGRGSSAMILAHALLYDGGYRVTVISGKTAQQWYDGPPTGTALAYAAGHAEFADMIFKDYFRPRGLMSWITDSDAIKKRIGAFEAGRQSLWTPS